MPDDDMDLDDGETQDIVYVKLNRNRKQLRHELSTGATLKPYRDNLEEKGLNGATTGTNDLCMCYRYRQVTAALRMCGRTMWHHEFAKNELEIDETQPIEHSVSAPEIAEMKLRISQPSSWQATLSEMSLPSCLQPLTGYMERKSRPSCLTTTWTLTVMSLKTLSM